MPATFIMAAAAIAGVGMTAYSMANQPDAPDAPNLTQASRAGILAEAETLADRRRMEAAAQQGAETLRRGYREVTASQAQKDKLARQLQKAQADLARLENTNRAGPLAFQTPAQQAQAGKLRQQIASLQQQIQLMPEGGGTVYVDAKGRVVPKSQAVADFTGYGEADVQGQIARETAENLLKLQEKYGPQFIEEALKQQELADPEGAAARRKLYEMIMEQAGAEPDRPVARLLDEQVGEQLAAGRGLDRVSDEMLREAVRQSAGARGEVLPHGPLGDVRYDEPLTTGFAGEDRLTAAQQKALGWLTSGATPEDVEYRREQQTLSNLGSFVEGRTPQSQFQNLSGAQQGPAPYVPGQALSRPNGGTGAATSNAAMQGWGAQMNAAANQADPWMAGLSLLLSGASVAGNAGYRPLAQG